MVAPPRPLIPSYPPPCPPPRPNRAARRLLSAAASASWLVLVACGGGGGVTGAPSTSPNPSPTPPPVPAPAPSLAASQLAVLIAEGDAVSEAIGLAYQRARGIPDANLIRLAVPRGSDSISSDEFATLKASLEARLPATVQALLLTWMQPSRVAGTGATPPCSMGITSALTLGYDTRLCGKCVPPTPQPYYNVDTRQPWTDLKLRPAMMLGAATLAEAQVLIARGVAADASMLNNSTTPQAWLVRTRDADRSVRFGDFQALASSSLTGVGLHYVDNSSGTGADEISGQANVMFYLTGLEVVRQVATNAYLPGALGDSLTSFAGFLPDGQGQMPITRWLQAGLTGSYGTQEEPCNYTEKFPRATVLAARYRRGETLIEAYWKSVQAPGQGLFIGEPLARPWAVPP